MHFVVDIDKVDFVVVGQFAEKVDIGFVETDSVVVVITDIVTICCGHTPLDHTLFYLLLYSVPSISPIAVSLLTLLSEKLEIALYLIDHFLKL